MVLHAKNADAWQILNMRVAGEEGTLAAYGAGLAMHYEPDEYRRLFARVLSVQNEPGFHELLEDLRERAQAEREREQADRAGSDGWG